MPLQRIAKSGGKTKNRSKNKIQTYVINNNCHEKTPIKNRLRKKLGKKHIIPKTDIYMAISNSSLSHHLLFSCPSNSS